MNQNKPLVYLITEGKATAENFDRQKAKILEIIKIACEIQVSLIQIREKNLPAKLVFQIVSEAAKIIANSQTKLLVNDRADIALAAKADGVHLTENSLSAYTIRQNFPEKFIVGVSAHSLSGAELAKKQKADFVTFSPIFATPDKGEPKGLAELGEVCHKLENFPVIALGGIDENSYKMVLEAGASGFAAIRFLNNAENLRKLTDVY